MNNQMIKRISGAVSVTALLLSAAVQASDTAVIQITGRVVANTCTLDSSTANQIITLDDVSDRDIRGKGKTSGDKEVTIILKDCGAAASGVTVTASGVADADDITAFRNAITDGNGGATGVGLYFYQADSTAKFTPDGAVKQTKSLIPDSDNVLIYKASYAGTRDSVTAGAFSTVINMKFDYM